MADRGELQRARADLGVFAALIGRPLTAWQLVALRLLVRTTVIVAPRQAGKSRALAVLAVWWAFRRPDQRVMLLSAGEEAAKRLLAEVTAITVGSPLLIGSIVDEFASLVRLSNGSEIRSVPASELQVRGHTNDLLLADEVANISDSLLLGAALPTTAARPHARVVLAGSPGLALGAFYDYARRGWAGSEHVRTFRWKLADATWISQDTIAALREGLTDGRMRAELDAEFLDADGGEGLIAREWIEDAQRRTLSAPRAGSVGLDVARFGVDRTTAYVNRGGRARLLFDGRGWNLMATTGRLIAALREEALERVVVAIDAAGLGGGVVDRAREQGVPVFAFVGAARAGRPERHANLRASTYWAMRQAFADGLVDLDPDDVALAEQLVGLRVTYDSRGRLLMESKDAMRARGVPSPDRADALSMTFVRDLWRPVAPLSPADIVRDLLADAQAAHDARDARHKADRRRGGQRDADERRSTEFIRNAPL